MYEETQEGPTAQEELGQTKQSTIGGPDSCPEGGGPETQSNGRSKNSRTQELSSLAQLNCTAEQLQAAVEIEIDKCFDDLAALAKSNFRQAITRPLSKRERKLAKHGK